MTRFFSKKLAFFLCAFSFTNSCKNTLDNPPIGQALSGPVDIATDPSGQFFYVLNADFTHDYESGSLLVLDDNGNKISANPIPRLGKKLSVSDNRLLIAFDHESDEETTKTMLFNIVDAKNPQKVKEWDLESCSPLNILSRKGYDYFALACQEGDLYIGKFNNSDLSQSTLKKVRSYPSITNANRRALYLDSKRDLLFMFPTDSGTGNATDAIDTDKETWVNGQKTSDNTGDEIPDSFQQSNTRARDILNNTTRFQFIVYDIKAEAAEDFPLKDFKTVRNTEPRWIYFSLKNFDGSPDEPVSQGKTDTNYYRTNFWEAQPDPDNPNVFYLSHRGIGKVGHSEHANDLVKVTLTGDPRVNSGKVPKLTDYMEFERVYGYKGDQTGKDKYFNSFLITKISGEKVVLLNSFRDLSNFSNPHYTLVGADLVEAWQVNRWSTQFISTSVDQSYYNLTLAKNGNLLTISFFDESLRLIKVQFGEAMTLIKSID